MLKAVRDHPRVVHAGFLAKSFCGVVLADDDGQVAGGIQKYLVAADSENGFHRNRFSMTG